MQSLKLFCLVLLVSLPWSTAFASRLSSLLPDPTGNVITADIEIRPNRSNPNYDAIVQKVLHKKQVNAKVTAFYFPNALVCVIKSAAGEAIIHMEDENNGLEVRTEYFTKGKIDFWESPGKWMPDSLLTCVIPFYQESLLRKGFYGIRDTESLPLENGIEESRVWADGHLLKQDFRTMQIAQFARDDNRITSYTLQGTTVMDATDKQMEQIDFVAPYASVDPSLVVTFGDYRNGLPFKINYCSTSSMSEYGAGQLLAYDVNIQVTSVRPFDSKTTPENLMQNMIKGHKKLADLQMDSTRNVMPVNTIDWGRWGVGCIIGISCLAFLWYWRRRRND
ncbi:hypothetical protein GX645_04930 [Candidatus Sumerlaeota bacterium]|nr:hypothetical protein [Candidatus Sumerlaeota bacterium]